MQTDLVCDPGPTRQKASPSADLQAHRGLGRRTVDRQTKNSIVAAVTPPTNPFCSLNEVSPHISLSDFAL
jgi:hypothetical protein